MGWVWKRRRLGGWLALGALALQLVLSFAHIHAEDFVFGRPGLTIATSAAGGGDNDRHGLGHDDCAICATVHLAGTIVTPLPPAFALPEPRCLARLATAAQSAPARTLRQAFQARAPPQA